MGGVRPVSIALVHHPVYNMRRETVATALTNLDVHDLARLARTYDVRRFYVVTPVAAQMALAQRIVDHWVSGEGGTRNALRRAAMERVAVAADVAAAARDVEEREGARPERVATGARLAGGVVEWPDARRRVALPGPPVLLLFGTGWGLHDDVVGTCDWKLAPVRGVGDGYNHLSVRTAVGIILDRLLGERGVDEADGRTAASAGSPTAGPAGDQS